MPLDSGGKVVLKVYNEKEQLLIARPCENENQAKKWFAGYTEGDNRKLTYLITAMVPLTLVIKISTIVSSLY